MIYWYLVKQETGMYKSMSQSQDLNFIKDQNEIDFDTSTVESMLVKQLDFTYDGDSITFKDEESLTDDGSYMIFISGNVYNDFIMHTSDHTVEDAKASILDKIEGMI